MVFPPILGGITSNSSASSSASIIARLGGGWPCLGNFRPRFWTRFSIITIPAGQIRTHTLPKSWAQRNISAPAASVHQRRTNSQARRGCFRPALSRRTGKIYPPFRSSSGARTVSHRPFRNSLGLCKDPPKRPVGSDFGIENKRGRKPTRKKLPSRTVPPGKILRVLTFLSVSFGFVTRTNPSN